MLIGEARRRYNATYYAKRRAGGLDIDRAMRLYNAMIARGHTVQAAREGVYMAARDGLLGYIQNKR